VPLLDPAIEASRDPEIEAWLVREKGVLFYHIDRFAEAEPILRHALAICEETLGVGHLETGDALDALGCLFRDTDRFAESEPLLRRALVIYEKILGVENQYNATALFGLGHLLRDTDRFAEAEPLLRRALAIYEKKKGIDHPWSATARGALAALLSETDRLDEADTFFSEPFPTHQGGATPRLLAQFLVRRAQHAARRGRPTAAAEDFSAVIAILKAAGFGEQNRWMREALKGIAAIELQQRR
jgi:tetratricopeptide (TPR) repeat protein